MGSDYEYRWEDTFRPTFAHSRTDATLDRWYNYDNVGRLHIARSGSEARAAYGETFNGQYDGPYSMGVYYDVWGNITSKDGWGGENPAYTATYTNNRRDSFGYDAAGNLTNDGLQSFNYDATGQQTYASGTGLSQSYDGNGLRGAKTESGVTTYYLRSSVLRGQVVAEINSSGAWTRGYVYAGGQTLAVQQQNAVSWLHQDPVTKSQRVTDANGTVVSTIELDPWGGDTNRSSNGAFQPKKYTSYGRDGNGSDEAMFRRYNRWHSRFNQPDPYDSYDLTSPQSFNRYVYAQNDPVNFVDPTGLMCQDIDVTPTHYLSLCDRSGGWGGFTFGGGKGIGQKPPQNSSQKPPCPPVPTAPSDANVDQNIADARRQRKELMANAEDVGSGLGAIGLWFFNQVKDKAPWDYKYRDPAINEGKRSKYEPFGNFNYGAAGAAAGFTEDQLLRIAGYFQTDKTYAEGENPGKVGSILGIGGRAPYGDEPGDYEQIRSGINYYQRKFVLQDCQ